MFCFRPFSRSVRAQGDALRLQHCPDTRLSGATPGARTLGSGMGGGGATLGNVVNGLKSFFIAVWIGT